MKIVILQDHYLPDNRGGAGVIAANFARMLQKDHEVTIITTTRGEDSRDVVEGVPVIRIHADYHARWQAYLSLYNPQTVQKVRNIFQEIQPDVVHAHNIHYYLSYHCLKLGKQSGAKVFLTAHDVMLFHYGKLVEYIHPEDVSCPDTFDYRVSVRQQLKRFTKRYNPLRNRIIRYYLGYVHTIFAVSGALKEALRQNGIEPVKVLHNGIEVRAWDLDQAALEHFRTKHNLVGKKVILFGGRLSEAKGGHQAVQALQKIVQSVPDAYLLVAGAENAYTREMKQLAVECKVAESLIFTGWIEDAELKASYHSSNLILVPSICFDSLPTVILEAMACKKPVVATCFGGARELVVEGESGYIVNPFDTELMAQKTIDLLHDSAKAQQFGSVGFERVQREFSLENITAELVDNFKKE